MAWPCTLATTAAAEALSPTRTLVPSLAKRKPPLSSRSELKIVLTFSEGRMFILNLVTALLSGSGRPLIVSAGVAGQLPLPLPLPPPGDCLASIESFCRSSSCARLSKGRAESFSGPAACLSISSPPSSEDAGAPCCRLEPVIGGSGWVAAATSPSSRLLVGKESGKGMLYRPVPATAQLWSAGERDRAPLLSRTEHVVGKSFF